MKIESLMSLAGMLLLSAHGVAGEYFSLAGLGDASRSDSSGGSSVIQKTSFLSSCADAECGQAAWSGEGCGAGSSAGCGWLDGLTLTSDRCFDGFIEPVSNPVFFEDPRSRTRLRFLFINQQIPDTSPIGGGDFQVYAAQATVALNERLSIIAQKDGYISLQADAFPQANGWADIAAGLKYVLVRDPQEQFLLSTGFMYELSNGSSEVLQGNGDGVWNWFLSTGKAFGEDDQNHFVSTIGWHLPESRSAETESLFYSLHLDRHVGNGLYGLVELNGIQYVSNGTAFPGLNIEGGDLLNLGSGNVDGNHFASLALGATQKVNENLEIGAAYEFPIGGREDLMDNRVTATISLIY